MRNIGNLKNLIYLDISYCKDISSSGMTYILNCENLEILYSNGIYCIEDSFFAKLGEKCKKLSSLKITCIKTNCKNVLTKLSKCKNLVNLYLRGVSISSRDFDFFIDNVKNYRLLDLGYCKNSLNSSMEKLNSKYSEIGLISLRE